MSAEQPRASANGSTEDAIRERSSPLVRKIAKEHNVDIAQIHGTGIAGRVTKDDILGFIEKGAEGRRAGTAGSAWTAGSGRRRRARSTQRGFGEASRRSVSGAPPVAAVTFKPGANDHVEKMSVMRKRIAEHMVLSLKTSAHVHSVFEVNFGRIAKIREAKKAEFERAGAKLTYMSFIIKAAVDALRAVPIVNASVDGDNIVYHKDVNVGIAVALDWGLIVPVIKKADEKNLVGSEPRRRRSRRRARAPSSSSPTKCPAAPSRSPTPASSARCSACRSSTSRRSRFSASATSRSGRSSIDDAIAIRPMAYLTLGYDHRVIDGAVADEFMSIVKKTLENWDPNAIEGQDGLDGGAGWAA